MWGLFPSNLAYFWGAGCRQAQPWGLAPALSLMSCASHARPFPTRSCPESCTALCCPLNTGVWGDVTARAGQGMLLSSPCPPLLALSRQQRLCQPCPGEPRQRGCGAGRDVCKDWRMLAPRMMLITHPVCTKQSLNHEPGRLGRLPSHLPSFPPHL